MSEHRWNGKPVPPSPSDELIMERYRDRPEARRQIRANAEKWKRLKAMSQPTTEGRAA